MADERMIEVVTQTLRLRCLELAIGVYGSDANRPPPVAIASAAFIWANFVTNGLEGAVSAALVLPEKLAASPASEVA